MSDFSRRDFLKFSGAGAIAAALPVTTSAAHVPAPKGTVRAWVTNSNQKHAALPELRWRSAKRGGNSIVVEPTTEYQSVLGFGAAFTDAACYTLNRLDAKSRADLFHTLFHPSEMGLSVSRICIGSSDYSRNVYSYCEGSEPDPEMTRFSIDHDRAYILPILREARAVNPDLWLLGSPWSPPAWMKFNGSMLGGCMRNNWYDAYANYFEHFLDAYAEAGVPVQSVTTQNEVDTDQDGRMPACVWPQEYELAFVREHLGPRMEKAKHPADIWILDHNYNLWGRALCELEDTQARKYVKGIAWHGYVGSPEAMTRVQQAYPNVDQFWTEGGPDFEHPGYATEWTKWAEQFTGILRNRARCIIGWNYALDENGKPNIGPFQCAGMVTVHSQTAAITYSGQYWAMEHFSRHIRRGAKILGSSGEIKDLHHVAARNPDGTYSLVLTNSGASEQRTQVKVGGAAVEVSIAPDSIMTISWS